MPHTHKKKPTREPTHHSEYSFKGFFTVLLQVRESQDWGRNSGGTDWGQVTTAAVGLQGGEPGATHRLPEDRDPAHGSGKSMGPGQTGLRLHPSPALPLPRPPALVLTSPSLFCTLYSQVYKAPLAGLVARVKRHNVSAPGRRKQGSGAVSALPFWRSCSRLSGGWVAWSVLPALC